VPKLHIRLLGDFEILYDEAPVPSVGNPRLQSLLAYLLLHCDAPQSRAHLAFCFWPDSTEAGARANLRRRIYDLRRALPDADSFLYADHKTVQWRPTGPFTLDVTEFDHACVQAERAEGTGDQGARQASLGQAIALYGGDLLPSCYDDWILAERERLRQAYVGVVEQLIQLLESRRDYQAAIKYVQHLLRHDPLHEAAYRRLMRLQALSGNRAHALRAYHTCVSVLHKELDVKPSSATRQVYEQLLELDATSITLPERPAPASPLVGRDEEWACLQAAWRKASGGRPHLVLLSGTAGIGKTRLAEELLAWASRQGIPTASARCYASADGLAYGPVTAWLQEPALHEVLIPLDEVWLGEIARLLPELLVERTEIPPPGPMTERWQRQRLFQALARPFFEQRQLLLLLDDLQWCDGETLEWMPYLLHAHTLASSKGTRRTQLLIVGTVRTENMPDAHRLAPLLRDVHGSEQLTEIELGPLNEKDTLTLASQMLGRELDPVLSASLYRGSEGNPLFVEEMVRAGHAKSEQWIADHGREQATVDLPLPPKVQRVIETRLAQLSPSARDLASVAATIGREFTFDVLAHARAAQDPRADEETLMRGLDELWQRRIIRELGVNAYDFGHDRIREVAYANLSAARRRFFHRRVAQAMETVHAADLDPVRSQIARHYEASGQTEKASDHYRQAAVVAQRLYANEEAIEHLGRAIDLAQRTDQVSRAQLAQLYEDMADLFALGSKHEEARQAYRQAMTCLPPEEAIWQARLCRKIGDSWSEQHIYDRGETSYDKALRQLGSEPALPSPEWWQTWLDIQASRSVTFYFQARLEEMEKLCQRTRPVVEEYGLARQRASFFHSLAQLEYRQSGYVPTPETIRNSRMALAWAQQTHDQASILFHEFGLAFTQMWSGNVQAAVDQLGRTLGHAERTGNLSKQTLCLTYLAVAHRLNGDLDQSRRYAERGLAVATEVDHPLYIGAAQGNLSWLAYRAGDLDGAERYAQAALARWGELAYPFKWLACWPLLAVELTHDRVTSAIGHARAMLDPVQQRLPEPLMLSLELAIQALDDRCPESAREHLTTALAAAEDLGYL
jgi:DNA-binding SARP family transcriptional activator